MNSSILRSISLRILATGLCTVTAISSAGYVTTAKADDAVPQFDHSMPSVVETGFVDSNTARIEYAVYGLTDEDAPVLLLCPPNGGDMHAYDWDILPEMSHYYKCIAVSPRATGNSSHGDGEITFDKMSDDLCSVLDYLGVTKKVDIYGFSDGGNLGLNFAVRHGDRLNRLAILGSNINPFGTKVGTELGIIWQWICLSVEAAITHDPETARRRDIKKLMVTEPRMTFADIATITAPVLNMYGENDMIQRRHSKKISKTIPDCIDLLLWGQNHGADSETIDNIILPTLVDFYGLDTSKRA